MIEFIDLLNDRIDQLQTIPERCTRLRSGFVDRIIEEIKQRNLERDVEASLIHEVLRIAYNKNKRLD
tara:strand:+ start:950 stop:1150 length:201 start_codon:yes stop_codon:yes gene_type:complete